MSSNGVTTKPRTLEFWGKAYLFTTLLLCAPSYLAWFRPAFNLGASEFDAWLGLLPSKAPGQFWHAVLFFILGLLFLRIANDQREIPRRYVLCAWVLFLGAVPWMSPDVSFYLAKGWMEANYALSPYTTTIAQIPGHTADPVLADVVPSIRGVPGNYGAIFQKLSALIATTANGRPLVGVLLFKIVSASALYACWSLIDRISTLLPGSASLGRRWIALNPLLLFNFVAAAHNDVFLMVVVLLGTWAALRGKWLFGGAALGVGIAFKLAPLFIFPAFGALAYRKQDARGSITNGLLLLFGLAIGVGASVAADPRSADFLVAVASNAFGGTRTSIHMVLGPWLTAWGNPLGLDSLLLGKLTFVVLGLLVLHRNFIVDGDSKEVAFVASCFELFLLAQFLVMPNMAEWYLLWPLCFAVLYARANAIQWVGRLSAFYMPIAIWHVVGLMSVVVLAQAILLGLLSMAHFGYFARRYGWVRDA